MAASAPSTSSVSSAAVEQELAKLRLYSPTLLNTATSHRSFFRWIATLVAIAVAAMFLPWQQNIQGMGTLTALRPQDRPQTLPSLIDGRIEQWYVREGELVKKGQLIARISEVKEDYLDPQVITRTAEQRDAKFAANDDKRDVATALAQQVTVLEQALVLKLDQTRNKIAQYEAELEAAVLDSAVAVDQLVRRESLQAEGLVDLNSLQTFRLKAQQANAKLAEKRAGLENARIDLGAARAEYGEKITKARADRAKTLAEINEGTGEVAKLDNKVASLKVRSGFYEIRAPQDGYVVQARRAGIGETIKAGDPLVTVQPSEPQQAVELFVKPMDVPLLRVGDQVRLQFDGWPALQFSGWPSVSVGTFGGRVSVVDRVSSKDGKFRVLVVADSTDEPWPVQLRNGSGVYGWAMLREVRVWFEIWRQLNGFPPSVNAPPTDETYAGGADAGAKEK
jgi:multidrug efflux pump subunit AcrA (membrane-fusion protein)